MFCVLFDQTLLPYRLEALRVLCGGLWRTMQSLWHWAWWTCRFSTQTDLRTLQGLLIKCDIFLGGVGKILNGDTGLNQSPPFLLTQPRPTPRLMVIRWTLTWNCQQLVTSSVSERLVAHLPPSSDPCVFSQADQKQQQASFHLHHFSTPFHFLLQLDTSPPNHSAATRLDAAFLSLTCFLSNHLLFPSQRFSTSLISPVRFFPAFS